MNNVTKGQVKGALDAVRAVADAIRELGSVPNGELYARLMPFLDLASYEAIISMLKRTGLVREELHVLKWCGPALMPVEAVRTQPEPSLTKTT